MLGKKLTRDLYEKLNDGQIATTYRGLAAQSLKQQEGVAWDGDLDQEDKVSDLGFLEYRLKIMDSTTHISADTVVELLSGMLGVNIIVLKGNGQPRTTWFGSRDCEYMKTQHYIHEKTILVASVDGIHYDLVAKIVSPPDDDPAADPSVFTVFTQEDILIQAILEVMCNS